MSKVTTGVDGRRIEKAVRKLAEENPDFVYINQEERGIAQGGGNSDGCSYLGARVKEGGEGHIGQACIIGQALAMCGYTKEQLLTIEGIGVRAALPRLGVTDLSARQIDWFSTVQMGQDMGLPWKQSVSRSDAYNPKGA